MKNFFLLLIIFILVHQLPAQISFDNVYSNDGYNLHVTKLHTGDYKYVKADPANMAVYLYNPNHSLFTTINIPTSLGTFTYSAYAYFVSEKLFDTDNLVECVLYTYSNGMSRFYIIKENGTIAFQRDSAVLSSGFQDVFQGTNGIFFDGLNTKMKLDIYGPSGGIVKSEIYTLSGSIPCAQCSEGTITGLSGSCLACFLLQPGERPPEIKIRAA